MILDLAPPSPAKGTRRTLLVLSSIVWFVVAAAYAVYLEAMHALGNVACEYPAGSSTFGKASWQWLPPGVSCTYSRRDVRGLPAALHAHPHTTSSPSVRSALVLLMLATWLAVLVIQIVRRRRSVAG